MKNRVWLPLIFILLLVLASRLAYSVAREERLSGLVISDMRTYDLLARNLAERGFYGIDQGPWPFRSYRPPLYPFLVSLVYRLFGYHHFAVRDLQAVLAAVSCLLLFFLGRELAGCAVALLGSFLFAADLSLVHLSGLFLSENLYLPLSFLLVWLLVRGFEKPKMITFAGAGIIGGLAALCRPIALPFLILVGLVPIIVSLWPRLRCGGRARSTKMQSELYDCSISEQTDGKPAGRGLRGWGVMLLAAGLTIAPWTLRNHRVLGGFVPISTNGGVMLWMGLHPGASGGYHFPRENNPLYITDEVKRNRIGYRESVRFVFSRPGEFISLMGKKMKQFWCGRLSTMSGKEWTLYLLLGVPGLLISFKKWKRWLIVYLYFISFTGVHLLVHGSSRYRLPLHPFVALWAALFLCRAWDKMRRRPAVRE